jgi:hypothetical protein
MSNQNKNKENHNKQDYSETRRAWELKIITHAWKDSRFREKLLTDPEKALREINCPIPANVKIKVIEETEGQWTLFLPKSPADVQRLSDAELTALAAAGSTAGLTEAFHITAGKTHCA